MRTHGAWYLKGLPNSTVVKNKLYLTKTKEDFINIMEEYKKILNS